MVCTESPATVFAVLDVALDPLDAPVVPDLLPVPDPPDPDPGLVPAEPVEAGALVGEVPVPFGGEVEEIRPDEAWVLNDSSRTRPAAVLRIARMTRRTWTP
jgi:hypothetical protein